MFIRTICLFVQISGAVFDLLTRLDAPRCAAGVSRPARAKRSHRWALRHSQTATSGTAESAQRHLNALARTIEKIALENRCSAAFQVGCLLAKALR